MHNEIKKGQLYGIYSILRNISLYMTSCCNIWTSKWKYRVVNHIYIYISLLLAACFDFCEKPTSDNNKSTKKDNINTIQKNDTFSGGWHLSFKKFQSLHKYHIVLLLVNVKLSLGLNAHDVTKVYGRVEIYPWIVNLSTRWQSVSQHHAPNNLLPVKKSNRAIGQ